MGDYLVEKLDMKATSKPDMKPWEKLVERVRKQKPTVKVALVGKYVELQDAYMSVREALKHAGLANDVEAMWLMLQQDEPGDYVVATGERLGSRIPGNGVRQRGAGLAKVRKA